MITWLRRLMLLALVGGIVYALSCVLRRRRDVSPPDEWPPLESPSTPAAATDAAAPVAAVRPTDSVEATPDEADADAPSRWVAPDDGRCPPGYPIKANDNSGIYHVPGGRFYDRTIPERCYAHAEDAEADGYRAAKS